MVRHIKEVIKEKMADCEELLASKEDWKAYKRVQMNGAYNMLSPMAVEMSGIEEAVYFDIIENYSTYEKLYDGSLSE